MKGKGIILIAVAVVMIALVATAAVIFLGNQLGNPASNQTPSNGVSLDQATTEAQSYLSKVGYTNLEVGMMQEYSNMYYAQVIEKNNGTGAFELMVNKTTGLVTPMQGPTMMWNTKYGVINHGMMGYLTSTSGSGGMMEGGRMMTWLRGTPTTNMAVSMEQARVLGQQYLDANNTGTIVGQVTTYYGYYTMQVMKDNGIVGMMGVDGNTGQVTYYDWMGTYMQHKVLG